MNLLSHKKGDVLFSSESTELAKYKLEIEIPAEFSKAKRRQSIAALKKNASFNGFRKGTIPPFIMKDIPGFVLRDSVDELLEAALKELELEPSEGEASQPEMDIDDMMKRFTVGEDFSFTCEMPLRKIISLEAAVEEEEIFNVNTELDPSVEKEGMERLQKAQIVTESDADV